MLARIHVGSRPGLDPESDECQMMEARIKRALPSAGFKGATLTRATGLWEGLAEPAWVLEIYSVGLSVAETNAFRDRVRNLARDLKEWLGQEAVLIAWAETTETLEA